MALPIYLLVKPDLFTAKIILLWMFLLHNLIPLFFKEKRDIGMVLMKTYWEKKYPVWKLLIYSVLYTASLATFVFYVYFPFDLLLVNLLLLQLPCVLLSGTTLHGYLSGGILTVKKPKGTRPE